MNHIGVREMGKRRYYGLHCSTRNRKRDGIMNHIGVREMGKRRYYGLHCGT
jgi:hypothetical protein